MLEKLINALKEICTAVVLAAAAYFYGKETTGNARLKRENQKLKKGLNAVLRGDYSPDAVRERMRRHKPED